MNIRAALIALSLLQQESADERRRRLKEQTKGDRFDTFTREVQERVSEMGAEPIFTTDADKDAMWRLYLDNAPDGHRECRDCRACKKFIEDFGGLVWVDAFGTTMPVMWGVSDTCGPHMYSKARDALNRYVKGMSITGVFLSSAPVLGSPKTGEWTHLGVRNPKVFKDRVKTDRQAMADKLEDFQSMQRVLGEYTLHVVMAARDMLLTGFIESPKHLAHMQWLVGVYGLNRNQIWDVVAAAPPGYCHVKSGVVGALLDDVASGADVCVIKERWQQRTDPLSYMRPQYVRQVRAAAGLAISEHGVELNVHAGSISMRYRIDRYE